MSHVPTLTDMLSPMAPQPEHRSPSRTHEHSANPLWNVATPPLGLSQTAQTGIQASGGGSGEGEMLKYPSISNHPPTLLHNLNTVTPSVT